MALLKVGKADFFKKSYLKKTNKHFLKRQDRNFVEWFSLVLFPGHKSEKKEAFSFLRELRLSAFFLRFVLNLEK